MIVRREVEDGYAGKSRPQYTEIPNEELEALTEDETDKLIEEYVQEDLIQEFLGPFSDMRIK